jgi:hypothetical protein
VNGDSKYSKKPGNAKSPKTKWLIVIVLSLALLVVGGYFFVQFSIKASYMSMHGRVTADMRSMATAIEAYYDENEEYPPMTKISLFVKDSEVKEFKESGGWELTTVEPGRPMVGVNGLTTPISYITSLPHDIIIGYVPFGYYTDGDGWVIFSPGIDLKYDIVPERDYDGKIDQPSESLILIMYDPTNGIISRGDRIRVRENDSE